MSVDKTPSHFNRRASSRGLGRLARDLASLDQRTLIILVTVPVVLTLLEYYGLPWHYTRLAERRGRIVADRDPPLLGLLSDVSLTGPADLQRYLWWGLACIVLLVVVYCFQFFAIEYFFRGFMTLGLKPRLGQSSILVMLAPYCMIHYYKPFPEALGAIGAGLALGALAWRTETIIYGWFLHYAVALSMDLLALGQSGRL